MAVPKAYDFSGYATKNDILCADGRIIRKDAFKKNDGGNVPLVWQHLHNEPSNILGHAYLENRDDGVYAYCSFNDTPEGEIAKSLVKHGDITYMSIYANDLIEKSKNVLHGVIREVSLVLAGANPGAKIEQLSISHSDGTTVELEDEAVIFTDSPLIPMQLEEKKEEKKEELIMANQSMSHAANASSATDANSGEQTIGEIFDTLTDIQKEVVYILMAQAIDANNAGEMAQSAIGDNEIMKSNVFDSETSFDSGRPTLSHAQFGEIMADAQKFGSFKESFLAHVADYGIENIEYLFPDAKTTTPYPSLIARDMDWVRVVMSATYHTPFSRIKSLVADVTAAEARAKGYVKASLKTDEVVKLLRRTTNPTTIYKKQKLDRDDVIDITDLDVVMWLKGEMRMMLDEEIGRAVLVGDGREEADPDKIDESCIRPIWKDDDMYSHHVTIASDAYVEDVIDEIIRARTNYKGSGNPVLFTTSTLLTEMLLSKDTTGRRIYSNQGELENALRVSKIVEVPVMSDLTRDNDDTPAKNVTLLGIIVNLKDYTIGADKGGEINNFEDFDIDYNQMKYLMETRISGALTLPKSALVIEQVNIEQVNAEG